MVGFSGYNVTVVDERKGIDPFVSGYEWTFQCSCGAVGEPDSNLTDGDVMECSECGIEWDIEISKRE